MTQLYKFKDNSMEAARHGNKYKWSIVSVSGDYSTIESNDGLGVYTICVPSVCLEPVDMIRSAILSDARLYRYVLWRKWDESKPFVMFIGLNPSTADETDDDPTIRRCISFAKSWGFGGLAMVNLWSWRCTDPKDLLLKTYDPVGPDNDEYLIETGRACSLIICAWGNGPVIKALDPERPIHVARLFDNVCMLAINKDLQPGHPLYIKGDVVPQFWDASLLALKKIDDLPVTFRSWPIEEK